MGSSHSIAPSAVPDPVVMAVVWCRLGALRQAEQWAFAEALERGLLAHDPLWRATATGEQLLRDRGLMCEHGRRPVGCRECLAMAPGPDCITPLECRGRTCCPRERACSE